MRGRSYGYSPSPPRDYRSSRRRSPSPRGYYGGRGRDAPTSLLVRNLRHDCRPEDLRRPFGEFGPLKDVYLPRDYYSGEPRGFGFVQYVYPEDAVDAKYHMDGQVLLGRELTVVFAEENRKKPHEMRARGRSNDRKQSSERYRRSYSRSPDYSPSPRARGHSRGRSNDRKQSSERYRRSYSRSPDYSPSPRARGHSRSVSPQGRSYRERSRSRTPYGSRSPSRSPVSSRSPSRSRSRSVEPN